MIAAVIRILMRIIVPADVHLKFAVMKVAAAGVWKMMNY